MFTVVSTHRNRALIARANNVNHVSISTGAPLSLKRKNCHCSRMQTCSCENDSVSRLSTHEGSKSNYRWNGEKRLLGYSVLLITPQSSRVAWTSILCISMSLSITAFHFPRERDKSATLIAREGEEKEEETHFLVYIVISSRDACYCILSTHDHIEWVDW